MSFGAWLELIASGLITGSIYALVALGLNLQYGLMRILNIAHGEFLMLGAFVTWAATTTLGWSPLAMIPLSFALMFVLGLVIHRLWFKRLTDTSPNVDIFEARALMVCFGLMFLVQNFASWVWGGDLRGYDYLAEPVHIGGAQFAANKLLVLALSLIFATALIVLLRTTLYGKGVRALMQSPTGATAGGHRHRAAAPADVRHRPGAVGRGRLPAVDDLHRHAGHGRALHRDLADRHHAGRLRQHGRRTGRRAAAGRGRGAGHALHQPVAEVAAVLRHLHRRAAAAAQRVVSPQAMNPRQLLTRDLLVLFGLTGWAVAIPSFASEFVVSLALTCLMYIALATSWSLFCGTTRYLSLATAAFFGIGAYTSALALEQTSWAVAILLGAGIATGVAVVMGALVLHLRGTYFAVLTFGMTELIRHAITYWEKQVTGTVGRVLTVVPERDTIYLTMLLIAVLAVATSIVLRRTRFGLALRGIGSDEQRAMTLGVDTRLIKIAGFAITAAFAGAAGAAMSVRWTYIDPTTVFNPFIGFQTVLIALIGGAATLWGPLIAAIVFSLLAETLRLQLPQLYMMTLGLLLIWSVLYLPGGLASLALGDLQAMGARHARRVEAQALRMERRQGPRQSARKGTPCRPLKHRRCSTRTRSRCASAA